MKIGGIIAEYNPFHNGHLYQLKKLREKCDAIVVVMSGSFVQRGDIAITDKFTRAYAAVINGADLVVELPVVYCLSSAMQFAFGAVSVLRLLGIDILCFGTEADKLSSLTDTAYKIRNETAAQSELLKKHLKNGFSYPAAIEKVFSECESNVLSMPNNVLAIEYINALDKIDFSPELMCVQRTGVNHDSNTTENNIASASYIRQLLYNNENFSEFIPNNYKINDIRTLSMLDTAIISAIRIKKNSFFTQCCDLPNSLYGKLIRGANECSEFNKLVEYVKSKSVTAARIKRAVLSSFLGIDASMSKLSPTYIRVLAMNKTGASILKNLSKETDIITKTADYKKDNQMFSLDILSTDIASLCGKTKRAGTDYTSSPAFIKSIT